MPLLITGRNKRSMKIFKEYKTRVPFPPYGYRIYLVLSSDIRQSAKLLKKRHDIDISDDMMSPQMGAFNTYKDGKNFSVVVLPIDATVREIVHECHHAVRRMFKFLHATEEDELFAYTLDYLVGEVYDFQRLTTKRKKRA